MCKDNELARCFFDMLLRRSQVPDSDWPLITPISQIQNEAQILWDQRKNQYGSFMTVHGRSFENTMGQCLSTDDGDLFVHMWVMVLSSIHIGHPGSTVDYVIWRWRQTADNLKMSFMLPWNCYNQNFPKASILDS